MKKFVNSLNIMKNKNLFRLLSSYSNNLFVKCKYFFIENKKGKINLKNKSLDFDADLLVMTNFEESKSSSSYKQIQNASLFKKKLNIPSVTLVRTVEEAKFALNVLMKNKNRYHAWDTETIDVNIKEESPVGNGKVLCASCFIGPDIDFGNGPRLFIDNYGESIGLINIFKEYFEDEKYLKVWHNYGFDRHILFNHGINVK